MRAVPRELEEAAAVDGAAKATSIVKIVAPLLAPGVVATLLFAFISSWNEFLFALVVLKDPDIATLPLTLVKFTAPRGSYGSARSPRPRCWRPSRVWCSSPRSSGG